MLVLDQFESIVHSLVSMRNSSTRTIRVALAIFCAKMRLGLSNRVLDTMVHIQDKRVVSRIIHQVTDALSKDFAPHHIGFQHIGRQYVLKDHQTAIVNTLLTNDDQQVMVVMDGRDGEILEVLVLEYDFAGTRTRTRTRE
jgi:hypothetical protein